MRGLFVAQFTYVGLGNDGLTETEGGGRMMMESPDHYVYYCTGRRYCIGIKMELRVCEFCSETADLDSFVRDKMHFPSCMILLFPGEMQW